MGFLSALTGGNKQEQQQQQQQQQYPQQHPPPPGQQQPYPGNTSAPPIPPPPPQKPNWTTLMCECSEPVECPADWCCAFFCIHCAAAMAKQQTDGSNVCYNVMCWNHLNTGNWVRRAYHIDGVCGEDCACGMFCAPCHTRRYLTESRVRKQYNLNLLRGPPEQPGPQEWTQKFFGCGCCALFEAILCSQCVVHRIRKRLQPPGQSGDGSEIWFDCCCVYPTAMWGQTRHMYGIKPQYMGECGDDTILAGLCWPCALSHADRESKYRYENLKHLYGGSIGTANQVLSKVSGGMCT